MERLPMRLVERDAFVLGRESIRVLPIARRALHPASHLEQKPPREAAFWY